MLRVTCHDVKGRITGRDSNRMHGNKICNFGRNIFFTQVNKILEYRNPWFASYQSYLYEQLYFESKVDS